MQRNSKIWNLLTSNVMSNIRIYQVILEDSKIQHLSPLSSQVIIIHWMRKILITFQKSSKILYLNSLVSN
ncbi:hypothetical protein FGO68_gene7649 [Halteria grandinella]|uniref:Uncharacterized protein n=1 Tax=Halteria grandinella TaxID=5974 RepID=A0A8J8NXU6_HALGN|nr:hypothetical protein FGO68_gene7649 [Halteria grandinella]